MKKILLIILIAYICGFATPIIYKSITKQVNKNRVIYKIIVNVEKINLRKDIDLKGEVIREVYKGEEFEVIKYYEGNAYNWYNVIYDEGETGWLASGKTNSWVIVERESKDNE